MLLNMACSSNSCVCGTFVSTKLYLDFNKVVGSQLYLQKAVWSLDWYSSSCLVSVSSDGTIKLWSSKKGMCKDCIEVPAQVGGGAA